MNHTYGLVVYRGEMASWDVVVLCFSVGVGVDWNQVLLVGLIGLSDSRLNTLPVVE